MSPMVETKVDARFCSCPLEKLTAGRKVWVKAKGVLTTNESEKARECPDVIGLIVPGPRLSLNPRAEAALASL